MSWVRCLPPNMTESSGQNTNPADAALTNFSHRLSQQEQAIPQLMEQLTAANARYQHLEGLVQQIHDRLSQQPTRPTLAEPQPSVLFAPAAPGPVHTEMNHFRLASSPPAVTYSGEFEDCRSFLLQCYLAFERSPGAFSLDSVKISYVIGLLGGRALRWAEAKNHNDSFLTGSYAEFLSAFTLTFGVTESLADTRKQLWTFSQGRRSVAEITSWNEDALIAVFSEALNDRICDQLALCPEPRSLDVLMRLAISIDRRHQELKQPSARFSEAQISDRSRLAVQRSPPESHASEEPMQMGRNRLSQEERQHQFRSGLCMYCGEPGHFARRCPLLKGTISPVPTSSSSSPL
uniref:CCHC-type domain-containing protein n=1 Tax=Nothobranchius furzeri TaxID=105023 RepID=A0A8C6NZP8_NOTFU